MGRLLMELRDGKMEYKLPDDWNKALEIIGEKKWQNALQVVDKQHLQGFLIANNNNYLDYSEILFKEHLQLLYLSTI